MRRREFITLLSGAAAWPLAARAQTAGKLPIIGFLGTDPAAWSQWTAAFVGRLRELGWIEGRTISIEYRWSEGRSERYFMPVIKKRTTRAMLPRNLPTTHS